MVLTRQGEAFITTIHRMKNESLSNPFQMP